MPDRSTDTGVKLIVGHLELSTWQSYGIDSDMLTPADAFSFKAANPDGYLSQAISKGDRAKVVVDGSPQMIGYIDEVIKDCDENGAFIDITGRDLGSFAIDCSAPPIQLHGLNLKQIAEKLCGKWIPEWVVQNNIPLPQIKKMKIETGDSPWEVLSRFCEQAKVAIWIAPDGKGVIGKPNYNQKPSFSLRRYKPSNPQKAHNNILSGRVSESWNEQFSSITVNGASSNTNSGGGGASKFKGFAIDSTIRIERPKNVSSGNVINRAQAGIIAEEHVQKGQFAGWVGEYSVPGFYNNGKLWAVDSLCDLVDEMNGVGEPLYITRRRFYDNGEGRRTDITLHKTGVWLP